MKNELVKVRKKGVIAQALLNRPEVYNAVNFDLIDCLTDHMVSLASDNGVRGVVISGEGKAFCSGGDLKWAASFPQGIQAAFYTLAARLHQAVTEIRRMRKPVIAAVNGIAAGGGFSIALACDFRVMARSAYLKVAYTSNGLCIDGGGTFMLPRIVGAARALQITAFDMPISSEQCLSWGLATKVVEDGQALAEATAMAQELANGSINSFGWTKRLLTDSFSASFEEHLEHEREGLCDCAGHPDGIEGVRAFTEKRKPSFTSRQS